ncbi:MAG: ribosome small subunit-dependent GTPase A [Clostridia bacterium]|nr:ribosome small subunit-dependent GTPase A [Clostridia bacterium]
MELQGIILQSIGGFYYVEAADAVYECRARGHFRKQGITPLVGDHVRISCQADDVGTLEEILPRKNSLIRPPVANLDCLVIVVSIAEPDPNPLVIDKMIAVAVYREIQPVIVINKSDLSDTVWLEDIYRKVGIPLFVVSAHISASCADLQAYLNGKVCAFTGNSGVGKSSILNRLRPELLLETGEISHKLGRGRHTTRSACLYPMEGGGYLADTPGFSSLDLDRVEPIAKEELENVFEEFVPHLGKCRFIGCAHVKEKDCAVRKAVELGEIASSRYENYVTLYEEAKKRREWEK